MKNMNDTPENLFSALKSSYSHFNDIRLKAKNNEKKIIINQINVKPIVRNNADIDKWRIALKKAEGSTQNRLTLYNLYAESLLDTHLTAVIEKRIEAITNTNLVFVQPDGAIDDTISKMVKQSFFQTLLVEIMNTIFWGFTLVQLDFPLPNQPVSEGRVMLVSRKHVKPRFGIVVKEPADITGIEYGSNEWKDVVLTVGNSENLGLLLQACRFEIIKRANISDWAEFAETFGVDPIIAKYNNEQTREELDAAVTARGAGGSLTVPEDTKIETLSGVSKTGSSQLFSKLHATMNDEMSVLILGQTMTTTDSKSSGYAQGYIHSKVEAAKYRSDRRFVERILNSKLTPYLEKIGYKVSEGEWTFSDEDHIPLSERIRIDSEVSKLVPIDDEYFYTTYKIPNPGAEKKTKKDDKKLRSFFD